MRLTGKSVGGGEILTVCGRCGREKLYINVYKQVAWCHRCHLALGPKEVREGLIKPTDREVLNLRQIPSLIEAWADKDARLYLQNRGVREEDDYILYDPKGKRLYFRIWSPSPEYAPSYHTRSIEPGGGWVGLRGTKKVHYIYGEAVKTTCSQGHGQTMPPSYWNFCIVEGIWDALAIGVGAVALLGTQMSDTILRWLSAHENLRVWIWLDPDQAGIEASLDIANRLRYVGVRVVMINADKEPSEMVPEDRERVLRESGWL